MARWTFEYRTGVRKFDQQHVKLFDVLNDLQTGLSGSHKKDAVAIALNDLMKYADEHFQEEEKAMETAGYPGLETHQMEHYEFEATIESFQARAATDPEAVGRELVAFIKDKLDRHIKKVDTQYGAHLKGKL